MIRKLLSALLLGFCSWVSASQFVVHTNGDGHSRVLAKIFFPDAAVLASPGADGLLVWKRLDGNKNDVAIQIALAAHYLPFLPGREDYAATYDLLATLAVTPQLLMSRTSSGIHTLADAKSLGRPATVGWVGQTCEALVRGLFVKANVEMVYVSYKTPAEAVAAFLGGHIDFVCPAAAAMQQLIDAGTANTMLNLTTHHNFMLTTQVFVSREMPAETRNKLLALITKPLSEEDHIVAKKNGFTLMVKTGEEARKIFARDRAAWRKILKVQ